MKDTGSKDNQRSHEGHREQEESKGVMKDRGSKDNQRESWRTEGVRIIKGSHEGQRKWVPFYLYLLGELKSTKLLEELSLFYLTRHYNTEDVFPNLCVHSLFFGQLQQTTTETTSTFTISLWFIWKVKIVWFQNISWKTWDSLAFYFSTNTVSTSMT